jgi:hypothetical protein
MIPEVLFFLPFLKPIQINLRFANNVSILTLMFYQYIYLNLKGPGGSIR